MANAPARALDAQAEVGLLGVDEEALVEQPRAQKSLAAGEHERARGPVAVTLVLVDPCVRHALSPEGGPASAPKQRLAEARAALGKQRSWPQRAVGVVCHAGGPDLRLCVETKPAAAPRRSLDGLGIRIDASSARSARSSARAAMLHGRPGLGNRRLPETRARTSSRVPSVESLSTTITSSRAPPARSKTVDRHRSSQCASLVETTTIARSAIPSCIGRTRRSPISGPGRGRRARA